MHDPQFEHRLLYTQESASENSYVRSSIYAMMWVYPGSTNKTTSRARITIATGVQRTGIEELSNQTIIELWKETGWILLEEVFDDSIYDTDGPEEAEAICLGYLESFLLGIPQEALSNATIKKAGSVNKPKRPKKTKPTVVKSNSKPKIVSKKDDVKKENWSKQEAQEKLEKLLSELKKKENKIKIKSGDDKDKPDVDDNDK